MRGGVEGEVTLKKKKRQKQPGKENQPQAEEDSGCLHFADKKTEAQEC